MIDPLRRRLRRACQQVRHEVPLTSQTINCSLVLLFSIVNARHGSHGPATTRNRPARLRRNSRRLLFVRGDAPESCPAVLAGSSSPHPFFFRPFLLPQVPALSPPRVTPFRTCTFTHHTPPDTC